MHTAGVSASLEVHLLFHDALNFVELVVELGVLCFAQVPVHLSTLCHLHAELEGSLRHRLLI